ncbi:MAG: SDR family NAD(P)-dependent oxidoreductase, partial [Pseudomonadota bacterium]
MAGRLHERVAVITGGASGIGKGIAARFAAEDARVIIADVDGAAAEETAAEL